MSYLIVFVIKLLLFFGFVFCDVQDNHLYWKDLANKDIEDALFRVKNENIAKNVIIFIGDGLGPETLTAARIYGKTENGFLSFEKFPYVGNLKTYSANKLVPDSCSTATAMFSGVKTNHKTVGVDPRVQINDCNASLSENNRLESLFLWAQSAGKATGFVTTTRITHATPAPLYAHSANRNWECESKIPQESRHCKDIARQLIEDLPGKNIKVIMGGGRQCLVSNVTETESDPIDTWACYSSDGRDLIREWEKDKDSRGFKYSVVNNNEELQNLNTDTDFVLAVFANSHLNYNYIRDRGSEGMPSLSNMTEKALHVLKKENNGFFLMVEGGLIDFAHHRGFARIALDEVIAFSDAIETTMEIISDIENETLVIVTADHSHSMVFTGYPDRNASILGIAQKSPMDGISYTSLLYGTGGPNNYQYSAINSTVVRRDPSLDDTESFLYSQQAAVLADEVYHSGTDVNIYAKGPMSHLIQNTHEQTYVAYMISYASKIGPFKENLGSKLHSLTVNQMLIVIFALLTLNI